MLTAIDNAGRIIWWWVKRNTKSPIITIITIRRLDPPATKEEIENNRTERLNKNEAS